MILGKYKPEDNLNCQDGKYAHHTGQGNTGSIGISMCGMAGFNEKTKYTKYPLTKVQCEKMFYECAKLAKKYSIPITEDTVLTHYEFNKKHNIKTGKIDIVYLPPYPNVQRDKIGDFIRSKILWYHSKLSY